MKIRGLDGKEYKWSLSHSSVDFSDINKSKLHLRARNLLRQMFPFDIIHEELALPGTGKNKLYADFYIPLRELMIEVHGEQHYKFVGFFHKNKKDFMMSKQRDAKKLEWCNINSIYLAELPFNKTDEQWRDIINDRR